MQQRSAPPALGGRTARRLELEECPPSRRASQCHLFTCGYPKGLALMPLSTVQRCSQLGALSWKGTLGGPLATLGSHGVMAGDRAKGTP